MIPEKWEPIFGKGSCATNSHVMPGLVPGIHVFAKESYL